MEATEALPAQYPINSSNASAIAKIRWDAWRERKNAELIESNRPKPEQQQPSINPLHARYLRQLDDLDKEWKTADASDRCKIAQAQAVIHGLLFPKPKSSRSRREFTPAEPLEPGQ